jgi:hypothetical protein
LERDRLIQIGLLMLLLVRLEKVVLLLLLILRLVLADHLHWLTTPWHEK